MPYGEVLNNINKDSEQEVLWRFKRIIGHQGPLSHKDKDYKGSTFNVQVEWENGEVTYEPLKNISKDDPVTCEIYACDYNLLEVPGWRQFRQMAKRDRVLQRLTNQAKLRSFNTAPR
jgi:hypothetical protein